MQTGPSKTDKLFFWIILGAYSTFFAEVLSGADIFPFFHGWGVITVTPLYFLHILAPSTVVFRHGKPKLYTLFAAVGLFWLCLRVRRRHRTENSRQAETRPLRINAVKKT